MRSPNHPQNHFWHKFLNSLTRLWRSLVRSIKVLFSGDLDDSNSSRSRRSTTDFKVMPNTETAIIIPRPAPFLLGLDDLPDLESLTTKEFIAQIEWNAESQEVLVAKEEDLTLLEDLLVSFPES